MSFGHRVWIWDRGTSSACSCMQTPSSTNFLWLVSVYCNIIQLQASITTFLRLTTHDLCHRMVRNITVHIQEVVKVQTYWKCIAYQLIIHIWTINVKKINILKLQVKWTNFSVWHFGCHSILFLHHCPTHKLCFLSCRQIVVNVTFSKRLIGCWSFFCLQLQHPKRPIKNVALTTKGLQERKHNLWVGRWWKNR